jgi:hypothetical protein
MWRARVTVAALAFVGLFAMHGLSAHGVNMPDATPDTGMNAIGMLGAESMTKPENVGEPTPLHGPGDGQHSMALGLCLGLLFVAYILAQRPATAHRWAHRAASVKNLASRIVELNPPRARGPDLLDLCVCRC